MNDQAARIDAADRQDRAFVRRTRYAVQWAFVAITLYGGIALFLFFSHLQEGRIPPFDKPLSVEGFMPIGALMALKLWATEGVFDPVHPAALVIFIAALLLAVLAKKGFCGWICPVGTVSDSLWKAGRRMLGRIFALPRFIDYPLRSVKYLLLIFFLHAILFRMSSGAIRQFLVTPYWKISDLKLLDFFLEMSVTTGVVLVALAVFSFATRNFWCRYLCPYGALLGLLSSVSPIKIRREESRCIHCHRCSDECPSLLPVEKKKTVSSPECIGCLTCVSGCPARGALDIALIRKKIVHPLVFVVVLLALFWGTIGAFRAAGHWKEGVTLEEYQRIVPAMKLLMHP